MRRSAKKNSRFKTVLGITSALVLCLIIGAAFVFGASALAVLQGKTGYQPEVSDVIIVPGAKTGSITLHYRCDRALELYRQGYAAHIITTGAKGDDEWRTEAEDAAEYLIERGIPREAVVLDDLSFSTEQNLKNAQDIMQTNHWEKAIIATSDFHVYRCMQLARKLNIKASGASSKIYELDDSFAFREICIVMLYSVTLRM